jgi:hypothetical protein
MGSNRRRLGDEKYDGTKARQRLCAARGTAADRPPFRVPRPAPRATIEVGAPAAVRELASELHDALAYAGADVDRRDTASAVDLRLVALLGRPGVVWIHLSPVACVIRFSRKTGEEPDEVVRTEFHPELAYDERHETFVNVNESEFLVRNALTALAIGISRALIESREPRPLGR